jgi:hypothetical protein
MINILGFAFFAPVTRWTECADTTAVVPGLGPDTTAVVPGLEEFQSGCPVRRSINRGPKESLL